MLATPSYTWYEHLCGGGDGIDPRLIPMYLVAAFDNGLLCGILLPHLRANLRWTGQLMLLGGIQLTQAVLILVLHHVFKVPFFLLVASGVLAWISVQTMVAVSWLNRDIDVVGSILKIGIFTVIGNLDDVLWIGGTLNGRLVDGTVLSVATTPVALFVTAMVIGLCEKHRWILAIAALLTAYGGSELFVQTAIAKNLLPIVPLWGSQVGYICLVTLAGIGCLMVKAGSIK